MCSTHFVTKLFFVLFVKRSAPKPKKIKTNIKFIDKRGNKTKKIIANVII